MRTTNRCRRIGRRLSALASVSTSLFAACCAAYCLGTASGQAGVVTTYTFKSALVAIGSSYGPVSGTLYIDYSNPWVAGPGSIFDFGFGGRAFPDGQNSIADLTGARIVATPDGIPVVNYDPAGVLELGYFGSTESGGNTRYMIEHRPDVEYLVGFGDWIGPVYSPPPPPGLARQVPTSEYSALQELFATTGGESWNHRDGWNDPAAPTWIGVTVSDFESDYTSGEIVRVGYVTGIALSGNNLTGKIPESIGSLVELTTLALGNNSIAGPIPDSVGNLINLFLLSFEFNNLEGSVPKSLGNLEKLELLFLSHNRLSGSIPETIGNLAALQRLSLDFNELTGTIPNNLGSLLNLQSLNLEVNHLSGSIPESFGMLQNLQGLLLGSNQLSGMIPAGFRDLERLETLSIERNCFDITPGSAVFTIIQEILKVPRPVIYSPQNPGCGPLGQADLDNDGCVDRSDLAALLSAIRARSSDLTYDLNGDGKVDIADARFLVLHFSNRDGSPCATPANSKIVEHFQSQTTSHNLK